MDSMWVAMINSALNVCIKCYKTLVKKQLTWKEREEVKATGVRGGDVSSTRT